MSKINFTVAADKCIQGDACAADCPRKIIDRDKGVPFVRLEMESECLECQHCLAVCPTGAVSIFHLNPEDSLPLSADVLPSLEQMSTLVRGRRSVRQFREENVPRSLIDGLLATLGNSPTGCNDRDLTFSVIDERAQLRRLIDKIATTLESKTDVLPFLDNAVSAYRQDGTDEFFRGAPHLLIVSAGKKATCPQEDINLALAYFELLARCAGLGTTWCGMLKFTVDSIPEIRSDLGLEQDTPFYAMIFGYPNVHYARTVQRDRAAVVKRVTFD